MTDYTIEDATSHHSLVTRANCGTAQPEIADALGQSFATVWHFMQDGDIAPAGPALAIYYIDGSDQMKLDSGFIVTAEDAAKAEDDVQALQTPAGRALMFVHKGPYSGIRAGYQGAAAYLVQEGLKAEGQCWELYVNDPSVTPEEDLLTECRILLA